MGLIRDTERAALMNLRKFVRLSMYKGFMPVDVFIFRIHRQQHCFFNFKYFLPKP